LKLETVERQYWIRQVLEKNPPKQGLKQSSCEATRETERVLEKNPPKQGLKHSNVFPRYQRTTRVLEKNPPKQGLKLE